MDNDLPEKSWAWLSGIFQYGGVKCEENVFAKTVFLEIRPLANTNSTHLQ